MGLRVLQNTTLKFAFVGTCFLHKHNFCPKLAKKSIKFKETI